MFELRIHNKEIDLILKSKNYKIYNRNFWNIYEESTIHNKYTEYGKWNFEIDNNKPKFIDAT